MDLLLPPEPLTGRERRIAVVLGVVAALSRLLARAQTLWDWDEALFCLGMREYDVTQHHPHPPGFPLYIALGRAVRMLVGDDFRSLQAINLAAGMLLFPALFFVCRELRLRFEVCALASTLCAFFPNVWVFGGTAFSDVPSIVLVLFAVGLLLRGCRDRRAYLAGTFVLALSVGVRPQNFLIGLWPGLLATRYRMRESWRDVIVAAAIGAAVVGAAFGGAARATGSWDAYIAAVRSHGEYISRVDSWRSAERPSLPRIFDRFFVKQYQSPPLSVATSFFVLVGVIGAVRARDRRIATLALAFVPFAVTAWLMLDRFSINRFSIGYCPLFAVLAAEGIMRISGSRPRVGVAVGGTLAGAFVVFTWPALAVVRNEPAPPVAAVQAALANLRPDRDQLYVATSMIPFAEYYAAEVPWIRLLDERALPLSEGALRPWLLAELDRTSSGGFVFRRERKRLWNIVRRHYFDASLAPLRARAEFRGGWYPAVREGQEEWRWMADRGEIVLPPGRDRYLLRFHAEVPEEVMTSPPQVTVRLNGSVIDTFRAGRRAFERDVQVRPSRGANLLELTVDRVSTPALRGSSDDPRELGLRLRRLSWGPK